MTPEAIEELRRLEREATAGPWEVDVEGEHTRDGEELCYFAQDPDGFRVFDTLSVSGRHRPERDGVVVSRGALLTWPTCRRCSECEGALHHWLAAFSEDGEPWFECKHCNERAEPCDECEGPVYPTTGQSVCNRCTASRGDFEP